MIAAKARCGKQPVRPVSLAGIEPACSGGVGHFGDNPYFIRMMHDWFRQNRDRIAYAAYFNVDGLWPTQIDTGRFPPPRFRIS